MLFDFIDSLSPSVSEPDLPLELKKLMQALCCELCNVKLNSPITAKIHYDSKVHEKKVRLWLEEWTKTTGNPIPERLIVSVEHSGNSFDSFIEQNIFLGKQKRVHRCKYFSLCYM